MPSLPHQEEDDPDDILASLEEEEESEYRAQRLQELSDAATSSRTTTAFDAVKKHFITLKSDDETLAFSTEYERAVVHFFHPDFARCNTMDGHCEIIAEKHADNTDADVAFARVDVKNCPFVVAKLNVRVLPCVIGFVKGVVKGRVTGFEGLCWDGQEGSINVTRAIEEAFVTWSILRKRLLLGHDDDASEDENGDDTISKRKMGRRGIAGRKQGRDDEDDDWD
ncbi:thioredoxin-like protein [Exophiala viscosa]|uniref:Thioredoxin-like protein n=1 Tax=Exophiala viscosa TaxID=2486360 RepID=A0AAN6DVA9_9EURO|nr:thioredoxin-like protein [Exophiala viscosa]KAI1622879.1 thioredoxin-like protein [Exophiala viscosa]